MNSIIAAISGVGKVPNHSSKHIGHEFLGRYADANIDSKHSKWNRCPQILTRKYLGQESEVTMPITVLLNVFNALFGFLKQG